MVFSICQIILFRSSVGSALLSCFTLTLGSWAGYAIFASLLALPGWLFRGRYRFKPIFFGGLMSGVMIAVFGALMPFLAHPFLRWPAMLVIVAAIGSATALGWFSFLLTLLPERLLHQNGRWSLGFGVVVAVGWIVILSSDGSQRGLKNLFGVSNTNLVRMLSGHAVETETIGAPLAEFVKKYDKGGEPVHTIWLPTSTEEAQIVAPPMVQASVKAEPLRDPASICPTGIHTIGSGAALTLSFRNTGTSPVTVFWMDPNGSAKQYRTLGPAESYAQPTYAGHGWAIFDSAHRCLRAFTASAGMSEVPVSAN
jgi:hypothetical protein